MTNTHMPFIARHSNETMPLCCRKVNGFWKIHQQIGEEWVRLNTQQPEDATECSPTAEYRDGEWRISFISGGAEADRLFRLYQYIDGAVTMVKEPAYVGFINRKMLVYGGREKSFTMEFGGAFKSVFEAPGLEALYQVSYDAAQPSRILISGKHNGRICSWVYDLGSWNLYDIEVDGEAAYKCTFFNGKCYYAKQIGEGFEDREVVEAKEVKITPLSKNIFTVRQEK